MDGAIDYAPPPARGLTQRAKRRLVISAVVVAGFLIGWSLLDTIAYQRNGWLCVTCGSFRSQKDWVFGRTTSHTIRTTALNAWITQHQGGHAHAWRHVVGTYCTVLGRHRGSGHGSAPAIYSLAVGDAPLVDDFVRASSNEEVAEFLRLLTQGTEREQRDAVDRAGSRALDAMK